MNHWTDELTSWFDEGQLREGQTIEGATGAKFTPVLEWLVLFFDMINFPHPIHPSTHNPPPKKKRKHLLMDSSNIVAIILPDTNEKTSLVMDAIFSCPCSRNSKHWIQNKFCFPLAHYSFGEFPRGRHFSFPIITAHAVYIMKTQDTVTSRMVWREIPPVVNGLFYNQARFYFNCRKIMVSCLEQLQWTHKSDITKLFDSITKTE